MAPQAGPPAAAVLRITLKDTKPPIWREVLVASTTSLLTLHLTIQAAMGWWNAHLYEFEVDGERIGEPDPDWDEGAVRPSRGVKLSSLLRRGLRRFTYLYDFGDGWTHTVEVRREMPLLPGEECPSLLGGLGRCPPEDVGGTGGFEEFLAVMADPGHPEHEETRTWYGGQFDPDDLDLPRITADLAAIARRRARRPPRR